MRAVRVHEFGGPEILTIDDLPVPEPLAGEARVKLVAAGVNFIDTYHRKGLYPNRLPLILGTEGAGRVDAVGPGVKDFAAGDLVAYYASRPGSYAEYDIVPASRLVPVPEGMDLMLAAAALVQGMTAHYLSHSTYPLGPGKTALIHAAAGGTGRLLVQMAKMLGARVLATAGSPDKVRLARSAGADEVIPYTTLDFEAEIRRLTDGKGVDVVYDSVGKDTFDRSLNCLHARGYLVLFGQSSGPVPPMNPQILNSKGSLYLTRPTLGHYIADRAELLGRAGDVFAWMQSGKLEVRLDKVYPLDQAAEAHRYLEGRHTTGKVVLKP